MTTGASGRVNGAWSAVSSQNGRRYDAPRMRSHEPEVADDHLVPRRLVGAPIFAAAHQVTALHQDLPCRCGHRLLAALARVPISLCCHKSTMKKRAGVTEKISISLGREDLKALKRRARRLHGGNLSAVVAELAADAKLLEGMHDLVDWLGGPSLTSQDRETLDRTWRGEASPKATKTPAKRVA